MGSKSSKASEAAFEEAYENQDELTIPAETTYANELLDRGGMLELQIFYPHGSKIHVLHWNVLAQQLTKEPGSNDSAFPKVDDKYMAWEHRKPLFEQEFFRSRNIGSQERMWDVICLQECDVHDEMFVEHPIFKGARLANGTKWSCAIFYNSHRLEEVEGSKIERRYKDPSSGEYQSQHCVGLVLREKSTGMKFAVVTTHLKAKPGFEEMRRDQAAQLTQLCESIKYPIILTGDFNDVPDSMAIEATKAAGFENVHGETGTDFTTSKYREKSGLVTRTIDYIFYKNKANETGSHINQITGSYLLPQREDLPEFGYPSYNHPSDHLALGEQFMLIKK